MPFPRSYGRIGNTLTGLISQMAAISEFPFHLYINSKRLDPGTSAFNASYQKNRLINGTLTGSDLGQTHQRMVRTRTRSTGGFSVSSERIDMGTGWVVKVVRTDSCIAPSRGQSGRNFPVVANV